MKTIWLAAAALVLSACSSFQVGEIDPKTGYLKASVTATVVKSEKVDLDARKGLLLVQNDPFVSGQIQTLNYFTETMTSEDLEGRIIKAGLGDKVVSVRERIGINNAAKHYKPFLWLHFDVSDTRSDVAEIMLTDPLTMDDIFKAEVVMDVVWAGANDQNTWYPLFNALIQYIRANSATYASTTPATAPAAAQ